MEGEEIGQMGRNPGARWEWRGKAARKRAESERRERERCKGCRYKGRDCERKAREEVGRVGRSFGSGWAGPDSVVLRGGHGWPWGEGTGPPPPTPSLPSLRLLLSMALSSISHPSFMHSAILSFLLVFAINTCFTLGSLSFVDPRAHFQLDG